LRETIFNGGKDFQGYSIADISYQAAKLDLRRVQNETEANLIASFYDVLKANKNLSLIQEATFNLKRNLEQTQIFYAAGMVSNVDLLRLKTQVANLEISRIQAENGLGLARMVFENNLGEKLAPEADLEDSVLDSNLTLNLSAEAVLLETFAHRPEWKAYKMGLEVAEKAISLTYGNFFPSLSYIYSWGVTKSEYPGSSTHSTNINSWRSLLVASWSIFDGFSTINQIKDAQSQLKAAQAQEKIIRDGIALEVKSAYLNLISTRARINAAEIAANLAEKTLKTAEINYKANIISEQSYLDVQTTNQASQLLLWTARYDFEVAKAKLNKAVGKKII
jgi:outer membrane protein TolC